MNNLKLILLSTFKNEKSILTKKDYLIALYGGFNIVMIALFFYYQIFLNWYSIINFISQFIVKESYLLSNGRLKSR